MAEGVGNAPTPALPVPFSRRVQPACICLPSVNWLLRLESFAESRRGLADPMGLAPTAFPQTTGCSADLSYGSNWWEVLVTLQSSLPVPFATPGLQPGNRITSLTLVAGVGVAAGPSLWQEDLLLLNHSRGN